MGQPSFIFVFWQFLTIRVCDRGHVCDTMLRVLGCMSWNDQQKGLSKMIINATLASFFSWTERRTFFKTTPQLVGQRWYPSLIRICMRNQNRQSSTYSSWNHHVNRTENFSHTKSCSMLHLLSKLKCFLKVLEGTMPSYMVSAHFQDIECWSRKEELSWYQGQGLRKPFSENITVIIMKKIFNFITWDRRTSIC